MLNPIIALDWMHQQPAKQSRQSSSKETKLQQLFRLPNNTKTQLRRRRLCVLVLAKKSRTSSPIRDNARSRFAETPLVSAQRAFRLSDCLDLFT